MKIQYKQQKFQEDAAKAVVDVFAGQPRRTSSYIIDSGDSQQTELAGVTCVTGWRNEPIVSTLSDETILENLRRVQAANQIVPSSRLEGHSGDGCYNLTIEMETGVGKTYTYIKTMYELNRAYGWSKFIVVVPSIAIREGVYKSFEMTQEHFAAEYGKKIRFFIYSSLHLADIEHFASDNSISAMIINSQAFNARGKDARRIYVKLDILQSRRAIDIIAKTNPILIIDEPQSVEGRQTKQRLKEFHPLLILRYSATHRSDSIYNMVYRLDAMDAYNQHLVKKIAVKGISESGSTATNSYLYLESINLSSQDPTATLQFEVKSAGGAVRKKSRIVKIGDNLYDYSGGLEEYRTGFVIKQIDGRDNSLEFLNGMKIYAGDVVGTVDEIQLRRIQIRETILTHIQRERQLFHKGIKVLSLFFIDEVSKYRQYDAGGHPINGIYADIFEEEYNDIVQNMQICLGDDEYIQYLDSIDASKTHAGYFSVDGKGKMVNSKVGRRETTSDDVSAYDLIMKNKELLLDRDPVRSPVRFIFSHSALREGWDNPNVFQICTLKQSGSDIRKRQEVGRGLRLCVNQNGERMDTAALGEEVHNVNVLTVIASESYDSFSRGLQSELAEAVAYRPRSVTADLFMGKTIEDSSGTRKVIDQKTAQSIYNGLKSNHYIDQEGNLTNEFHKARQNGGIKVPDEIADFYDSVIQIIDSVYDPQKVQPVNARDNNVELHVDNAKLGMAEFQELWSRINAKTVYVVDFDTDELIQKAIEALNVNLHVTKICYCVETGTMNAIQSKDDLLSGTAFEREKSSRYNVTIHANANVKYDLIGKLVEATGLTRKTIAAVLRGIEPAAFNQFKENPEEFISKAAAIINDEKATAVIQHITYHVLDEHYETDIFTEPSIHGKLNVNAMKASKHLYDHLVYDSEVEHKFASDLEASSDVVMYVKLPSGFFISTPVGHYNPDWAIAFYEGSVKHIYFVAETKGSMQSMQLRLIEDAKIKCAKEHFKAISSDTVTFDVVDNFQSLIDKVMT